MLKILTGTPESLGIKNYIGLATTFAKSKLNQVVDVNLLDKKYGVVMIPVTDTFIDKTISDIGYRNLYLALRDIGSKENWPLFIDTPLFKVSTNGKFLEFIKSLLNANFEATLIISDLKLLQTIDRIIPIGANVTPKMLIVDTHNFYHRVYHALPPMNDSHGNPTNVIKAFSAFLKWILANRNYTHVVFTADNPDVPNFRKKVTAKFKGMIDEENFQVYKANRGELPEDLKYQIDTCNSILEFLGFSLLKDPNGYEADDLIASVVAKFKEVECHVFSGDKDLCQLFTYPNMRLVDVKSKKVLERGYVFEKFGVEPEMFLEYQGLIGDTADNIPGVKGIGPKTAIKLLNDIGPLESIYCDPAQAGTPSVVKNLTDNRLCAFMSRDLATLRTDLEIVDSLDIKDLQKPRFNIDPFLQNTFGYFDINY